ncbi:MAG: pirin-like C-terminal cupin domain-containing protein [Candidatus Sulfotelmatobacter sp.]
MNPEVCSCSRTHSTLQSAVYRDTIYNRASVTFRDSSSPRAVLTERVEKPDPPHLYDVGNHSLVLFDRGDEITVRAGNEGIRFLLVSGKPDEEPVAWYGPIVMNTQEQLREAIEELQGGSFIKHR